MAKFDKAFHSLKLLINDNSMQSVLFNILNKASNKKSYSFAWPSVKTLAREEGYTPRGMQLVLRKLENEGWIVVIPRTKKSGATDTNGYKPTKKTMNVLKNANNASASQQLIKHKKDKNPDQRLAIAISELKHLVAAGVVPDRVVQMINQYRCDYFNNSSNSQMFEYDEQSHY